MEVIHDVDFFANKGFLHGMWNWDELCSKNMTCFDLSASMDNPKGSCANLLLLHRNKLSRDGHFLSGEKCQTLSSDPPPLSWLTFLKGPAQLVYNTTLNLNISASRQNITNLVRNIGAIYVENMHAKFQASSFTSVGGEWGDVWPGPYTKFLNSPPLIWKG